MKAEAHFCVARGTQTFNAKPNAVIFSTEKLWKCVLAWRVVDTGHIQQEQESLNFSSLSSETNEKKTWVIRYYMHVSLETHITVHEEMWMNAMLLFISVHHLGWGADGLWPLHAAYATE